MGNDRTMSLEKGGFELSKADATLLTLSANKAGYLPLVYIETP